jgi:hypothetical protein
LKESTLGFVLEKLAMKDMPITSVSAVGLVSALCLNRTDSGLVGLFGRDRSDPAAHAKHYVKKNGELRK